LLEYTKNNTSAIGGMPSLPFLLKVLSINKALSLQVHPNKKEAERLHAEFPDIYKDSNHKPELAIALTPFLALVGFRPYNEISQVLSSYPEISALIGSPAQDFISNPSEENLKVCFEKVMRTPESNLKQYIDVLRSKFTEKAQNLYESTFVRLDKEFPNDVGCITLFFLNLVKLNPGEAVNLEANLPHAYLEGDCVECMACSDNVVRAGLTPKFKDVDTLIRMLDYSPKAPSEVKYQPKTLPEYPNTRAFIPRVKDFAVLEVNIPSGTSSHLLKNSKYGSILLVLTGTAQYNDIQLNPGSIIFLPANLPSCNLTLNSPFTAYQAMYNDF